LFYSFLLPVIPILTARSRQQPLSPFAFASMALVTWLLWQGAAYWRLKLQAVKAGSRVPAAALRRFAVLKAVNWALIGLAPALLIFQILARDGFRSVVDAVAGLGFYVLALLEQVNYYHWQLMYDYGPDLRYVIRERRLKRSSLSRAMRRPQDKGRCESGGSDETRMRESGKGTQSE
jgi:hypothetical protein